MDFPFYPIYPLGYNSIGYPSQTLIFILHSTRSRDSRTQSIRERMRERRGKNKCLVVAHLLPTRTMSCKSNAYMIYTKQMKHELQHTALKHTTGSRSEKGKKYVKCLNDFAYYPFLNEIGKIYGTTSVSCCCCCWCCRRCMYVLIFLLLSRCRYSIYDKLRYALHTCRTLAHRNIKWYIWLFCKLQCTHVFVHWFQSPIPDQRTARAKKCRQKLFKK